jgi:hypothetical protein
MDIVNEAETSGIVLKWSPLEAAQMISELVKDDNLILAGYDDAIGEWEEDMDEPTKIQQGENGIVYLSIGEDLPQNCIWYHSLDPKIGGEVLRFEIRPLLEENSRLYINKSVARKKYKTHLLTRIWFHGREEDDLKNLLTSSNETIEVVKKKKGRDPEEGYDVAYQYMVDTECSKNRAYSYWKENFPDDYENKRIGFLPNDIREYPSVYSAFSKAMNRRISKSRKP